MPMFGYLLLMLFIQNSYSLEDLPDPRIIIVGATGAGKSSLANALLGCDPNSDNCLFQVCDSVDSCTKETSYGIGQWLGMGKNCTVVDTPGFGDSDQEDDILIQEMMDVLKNSVGYTNSILLLLNGQETRFNEALQSMLKQMSSLFGEQWWEFMTIGVSFWSYDQDAIDDRNDFCTNYPSKCKDEAWFKREITEQLQEKFHLKKNFTFVFTDSWSQTIPNNRDPVQQEHWKEETGILWEIMSSAEKEFEFRTIDDILEENEEMKNEIKWLNEIIANNISELSKAITQNGDTISTIASRVNLNEYAINTIKDKTIPEVVQNFDGRIVQVEDLIHEEISKVTNEMKAMHLAPVGTVTGWLGGKWTELPSGWQLCDGSSILSGPMTGQNTPNLNGESLFLRGAQPENAWNVEEDQIRQHGHKIVDPGHKHTDSGHTHVYADYYNVAELSDNADDRTVGSDSTSHMTRFSDPGFADLTTELTGITVSDLTGAAAGSETRPRNMAVEWIIKVE